MYTHTTVSSNPIVDEDIVNKWPTARVQHINKSFVKTSEWAERQDSTLSNKSQQTDTR